MSDYLEYTKGGDILIAPSIDCKHQYILKCDLCGEFYGNIEQFFSHYLSHYDMVSSDDDVEQNLDESEDIDIKELYAEVADGEIYDCSVEKETTSLPKEEFVEHYENVTIEADTSNFQTNIEIETLELTDNNNTPNEELEKVAIDEKINDIDLKSHMEFIENLIKNKENVTALIEAYKNESHLWDFSLPVENRKIQKRVESWSKISLMLKQSCNLDINRYQVAACIMYLRQKYRQLKKRGSKCNDILPTWIYNQLEFLNSFVESNPIGLLDKHQDLSPKQIIQVINVFQKCSHLWDTDAFEYYCTNHRNDALNEMKSIIIEEIGLEVNDESIIDYIACIRKYFSAEKRRLKTKTKEDGHTNRYYSHLMFLDKHVGPFYCSHCHLAIYNTLALKAHESQHTNTVPFKCPKCQKECVLASSYVNHMKRHMGDLNHVCTTCGKKFIRDVDLREHMNCHTGEKPFCCEVCGASFRQRTAFGIHKRRHIKNYRSFCPHCSKGFYCKRSMLRHAEIHVEDKKHLCPICGKAFKTKATLQFHISTHENGHHECIICGKVFKNKLNLRHHSRLHRIKSADKTKTTTSLEVTHTN